MVKSEFHLLIKNNQHDLISSINAVDCFLQAHAAPPRTIYHANLIFEEILTNIFKYAFDDSCEHEIDVVLSFVGTNLLMQFIDDGRYFDPLSAPPPQMKESIADSSVGGLGLHLVKQVVESIQYHRDDHRNVLRMSLPVAD
jgi:serine/threonine-protein kinase RsbW